MRRRSAVLPLLALLLSVPGASAQDLPRPTITAVRTTAPVHIDARLEEPLWSAAQPVVSFTQNDPQQGAPVSQRTEVRIGYDDVALYVAAVLHDTLPVQQRLARRDAWLEDSDWFSISLDSYNDRLTAYRFAVNPAGVKSDELVSGGGEGGDESWDPVWEVATAVTDSGWIAELRIPYSQLRFGSADEQEWGVQLARTIARLQEEAVFAFTPKRERGGVARYGRLVGLRGIRPGRGFELVPYVVARGEFERMGRADGVGFDNPFRDGSDGQLSAGADLKVRVAPGVTLDATVNPDFGQVEVDPAVINLSAYETRFQEKRPFFIEGSDIFRFGGETQLVYSRRIGARPSVRGPGDVAYTDAPESATILGAAKLTGRSARGWMFGLTDAVTAEEEAHFALDDGTRTSQVASPLTNYAVGRLERSVREGQTVFGVLGTAVHRRLGDLPLRAALRSDAYALGFDLAHEWAERAWSVDATFAASRIAGEPSVMLAAQRSSARYFQRPDADHISLDSAASSMSGYNAELSLRKQAGEHWRGSAGVRLLSPGFEVNDLGFQQDADRISAEAGVEYVHEEPGDVLREWNVELGSGHAWNYGGDRVGTQIETEASAQLLSYWSGELGMRHRFDALDDRLTRGGPLTRDPAHTSLSAQIESDERKPWVLSAETSYDRGDAGSGFGVELGLELRPSDAWSISFGPEYSRERQSAQYLGSINDALATHTFGRRYLFADLEQQELSLNTRVNVTFTPGLTFELYAQPLVASGAFDGVKELARPRSFAFTRYGRDAGTLRRDGAEFVIDPDGSGPAPVFRIDDDDFNERSLRGNAVLRWEWRPGSTLFLVWQQVREDEERREDLALSHSLRQLFRAEARNVFVIKASYWLAR